MEKTQAQGESLKNDLNRPLPLSPDNFTPAARTPWGGFYIADKLKDQTCPERIGQRIGESWDFSCEPSFPSKILGSSFSLSELLAQFPQELLSEEYVEQKGEGCQILVKILNAAADLSVQVHPRDDDASLKSDECGKFESWFVLHAEEGACIYLGFAEGFSKNDLLKALKDSQDLRPFLKAIPVQSGDYYEIPMGVCHAIGKGVVVLEPQRVLPSKKAKTYRIYDWDRRYNAKGDLDPAGQARELHVQEAIALVDPSLQSSEAFLQGLRGGVKKRHFEGGILVESFGKEAFYKFHRLWLPKHQSLTMHLHGAFGALIPIEGFFALHSHKGTPSYWQKGQPGFLGKGCFPLKFEAFEDCVLFIITPEIAKESWEKSV